MALQHNACPRLYNRNHSELRNSYDRSRKTPWCSGTALGLCIIAEVLTDIPGWMTGYGYGKITTWLTNSPLMAFCAEISRASALRRVSSPTGLSSGEKCADGAQNGWCHRFNLILAHQAQRHSVFQFRIHTRQPSLHDGGRIVFAYGTRHLKGES